MNIEQLRREMSRTADPFAAEAYLNRLLKEQHASETSAEDSQS